MNSWNWFVSNLIFQKIKIPTFQYFVFNISFSIFRLNISVHYFARISPKRTLFPNRIWIIPHFRSKCFQNFVLQNIFQKDLNFHWEKIWILPKIKKKSKVWIFWSDFFWKLSLRWANKGISGRTFIYHVNIFPGK